MMKASNTRSANLLAREPGPAGASPHLRTAKDDDAHGNKKLQQQQQQQYKKELDTFRKKILSDYNKSQYYRPTSRATAPPQSSAKSFTTRAATRPAPPTPSAKSFTTPKASSTTTTNNPPRPWELRRARSTNIPATKNNNNNNNKPLPLRRPSISHEYRIRDIEQRRELWHSSKSSLSCDDLFRFSLVDHYNSMINNNKNSKNDKNNEQLDQHEKEVKSSSNNKGSKYDDNTTTTARGYRRASLDDGDWIHPDELRLLVVRRPSMPNIMNRISLCGSDHDQDQHDQDHQQQQHEEEVQTTANKNDSNNMNMNHRDSNASTNTPNMTNMTDSDDDDDDDDGDDDNDDDDTTIIAKEEDNNNTSILKEDLQFDNSRRLNRRAPMPNIGDNSRKKDSITNIEIMMDDSSHQRSRKNSSHGCNIAIHNNVIHNDNNDVTINNKNDRKNDNSHRNSIESNTPSILMADYIALKLTVAQLRSELQVSHCKVDKQVELTNRALGEAKELHHMNMMLKIRNEELVDGNNELCRKLALSLQDANGGKKEGSKEWEVSRSSLNNKDSLGSIANTDYLMKGNDDHDGVALDRVLSESFDHRDNNKPKTFAWGNVKDSVVIKPTTTLGRSPSLPPPPATATMKAEGAAAKISNGPKLRRTSWWMANRDRLLDSTTDNNNNNIQDSSHSMARTDNINDFSSCTSIRQDVEIHVRDLPSFDDDNNNNKDHGKDNNNIGNNSNHTIPSSSLLKRRSSSSCKTMSMTSISELGRHRTNSEPCIVPPESSSSSSCNVGGNGNSEKEQNTTTNTMIMTMKSSRLTMVSQDGFYNHPPSNQYAPQVVEQHHPYHLANKEANNNSKVLFHQEIIDEPHPLPPTNNFADIPQYVLVMDHVGGDDGCSDISCVSASGNNSNDNGDKEEGGVATTTVESSGPSPRLTLLKPWQMMMRRRKTCG